MKLTVILVFLAVFQVSAEGYSQEKISVNFENVKLSKALKMIEKKSDFRFVYSNLVLNDKSRVSLSVKDMEVNNLLSKMLGKLNLTFLVRPNNLVIIKGTGENVKDIIVKGKVVNASTGQPISGASVQIKGSTVGTSTNNEGDYTITVPEDGVLVITSVGFSKEEVLVNGRNTIDVALSSATTDLEEVVVVAYGQTTKRNINSSISTLPMEDVAPIPVASINDAVGGRIPGVIVTADNGAPGAKSQISIRGGGTPLFVIDGVIRSQNDFENINPNDIASYSVLKDASATSLYGARGGNGVILVTTKTGRSGDLELNYSYNQIFSQPTIDPKKMSSYDHLKAINDVYISEGKTQPTADDILELYRDQSQPFVYPNTDWRKLFMKNFASEQRHDLSLSSGTDKLSYFASGSYFNQGSILKTDRNSNERITYRLNATSNLEKIGLKIKAGLDGFVEKNVLPNSSTASSFYNLFSHIQNKAPNQLAYNDFGLPSAQTTDNPAVELSPLSGYGRNTSRIFNSILSADWAVPFIPGLHLKGEGNYNMWNSMGKSWSATAPTYNINSTAPIPGDPPSLSETWGEGSTFILQGFVTYERNFGDHHIDFTGVYERAQDKGSSLFGTRKQYQIIFDQFIAGPTENQEANGSESESGRESFLGRLSYNYKSKYFLDATFRHDGLDLFPPGKRWGDFYAFAGGWIISSENFFQPVKDKNILNYLKLRASTGLTGTVDGIGTFQYVPGYNINVDTWVVDGNSVQGTSEPGSLPSTNFSWFSIRSWDVGFDFESLNGKLFGSFDYYYKRTKNYVVPDTRYAAIMGIGLPPINFKDAALRRAGSEFNLGWRDHSGDFSYQVGLNFTYYNQLWERKPDEDDAALKNPYTRESGTDNAAYGLGYISEGFYTHNQDLLEGPRRISSTNVVAGDLKYMDTNGDGKIDGDDFRLIGSSTFPHINYGFTFDLGYKGFYLNGALMGSGGRDRYLGDVIQGASAQAQMVYYFQTDYWRTDNTDALFPRAVSSSGVNGGNNFVPSDFWLLRSGYLRLKAVQLGYDFKTTLLRDSFFKGLRVFVSGTNLVTISKSKKYFIDPESDPNNYAYPIQRTISLGVNVSF